MAGREFVVEPDRWALPRRETAALRGPLRALPRRRAMPLWPLGLGVAGLSLAVAFVLAPRPAPAPPEPAPSVVVETQPMPRVVGAAEVPVPVAAPIATEAPAAEPPAPRTQPESPTPHPAAVRPAAPTLDVGQLPVLHLGAEAFETAPTAEAPPRLSARAPARQPAPHIAGQP